MYLSLLPQQTFAPFDVAVFGLPNQRVGINQYHSYLVGISACTRLPGPTSRSQVLQRTWIHLEP